MTRILIVGYGNPLRSDDGLGWRAAEELSRSLSLPEVEVLTRQQLTPELADNLTRADAVFFIDAARGGQPGDLRCDPVTAQPGTLQTHQCSPAGLLVLAQQLYGASPRAFVVSLCGECFDHGAALSATVEAGLPKLTALVKKMVREMIERQ
jgi:hydrogenase maturation protease